MLSPICLTLPYSRQGEQFLSDGNAKNTWLASEKSHVIECLFFKITKCSEIYLLPKSPDAIHLFTSSMVKYEFTFIFSLLQREEGRSIER